MAITEGDDLYYDPYDVGIRTDPYPVFRRLRDEAPLYYNEPHDFYALSRYDDVERALLDWETFSSTRGDILEMVKANIDWPPGIVIFEDPPLHSVHRKLLTRVFTPKKMEALEPAVRRSCAQCLDPLVGSSGFDLIAALGVPMPMRVIGMLLGIPEQDQQAVRDRADAALHTEAGQPMTDFRLAENAEDLYADYIDWRAKNPSDDLMTELLNVEFEDETGAVRTLTRDEILLYVNVVAGAGVETTTNLIGWTGKLLAEHPDQRRELVDDPSLVANAIEEILRYEPPGPQTARYVTRDVELHGRTVPAGSAMVLILSSANRDEARFPDGELFDIHRGIGSHMTLGFGVHYCLGAALARLEGRIALDELLKRFPEWDVDLDQAALTSTSSVRGYETLPIVLG